MRQFATIEKLDTAILYTFELSSSLSVLLLAFGLIESMANVLTKGNILTDNPAMQQLWAWTQCIAIDALVAGTILRTMAYYKQHEWVKAGVYMLLSALLMFTAAGRPKQQPNCNNLNSESQLHLVFLGKEQSGTSSTPSLCHFPVKQR